MSHADVAPPELDVSGDGRAQRRRRKEARPSELIAAALELFAEKGFSGTRLDDVATRAGVSKGTLYLYFDSKEALFKAVVEEGIVTVLIAAEQRLADYSGSASELLREMLFRWWEHIGSTPLAGVTKLITAESRNFPEIARFYQEQVIARGRALLRSALRRGIDRGEFRDLDVETAIDLVIAPLLMLAISRFSLGFCAAHTSPEGYLCMHFDLLINGLSRKSAAGDERLH